MEQTSDRAGRYVPQPEGHAAFLPNPLPPEIRYDGELQSLLSAADRAMARLDGMSRVLPNPDLFIAMYVRKEALLSSQIEGTQASLRGVLEVEASLEPDEDLDEIGDVINYIDAMRYGLETVQAELISVALITEIHWLLIRNTRGADCFPGEIRTVQNYVAPAGATSIHEAVYVPPPPAEVGRAMADLEAFIQADDLIPPLVRCALIHSQFETIHPFLDGNGRVGRLLITFYLCWKGIPSRPLLYLSFFLKRNRTDYYSLLNRVRMEGAYEDWIAFFLRGVIEVSQEAERSAREIISLREAVVERLLEHGVGGASAVRLAYSLFERPIVTAGDVRRLLGLSQPAANALVNRFVAAGILRETTGKQRYKRYEFREYLAILERGTGIPRV
ncbi:MAG: Fic family protein [Methanospirillum sp.]|nr:Fic family protein [Methanospirillum sp.]